MASRNNILLTLDKLSSIAEERSVVVIYFSGHGYELEAEITDDNIIHFDQGLLPAGLTREMVSDFTYTIKHRKYCSPESSNPLKVMIPRK